MANSVLFDAPGPRTVARHRVYTVVSLIAILALVAYAVKRLADAGQFEYALWEPFVTPQYLTAILEAWLDTIIMAVLSVLGAVVFGLIFGVGKLSEHRPARWASWLVVEFFRAVPVIMLMIFCFYAIFGDMGIARGAFWSVITALTFYNGAVLAEVFRAGVNAVPRGQSEAAYAIGMRKTQVMNIVLLPQAVKIMIPAIISQCVVAVKDTSLILIVFGVGLTKIAKQLPLSFNNVVATTLVIAACYVITNLVLMLLANYVQRKFVGEKKVLEVSMVADVGADGGGTV